MFIWGVLILYIALVVGVLRVLLFMLIIGLIVIGFVIEVKEIKRKVEEKGVFFDYDYYLLFL